MPRVLWALPCVVALASGCAPGHEEPAASEPSPSASAAGYLVAADDSDLEAARDLFSDPPAVAPRLVTASQSSALARALSLEIRWEPEVPESAFEERFTLRANGVAELAGVADYWPIKARLVNRSKKDALTFVRPNDGSDVGLREPLVEYLVDVEEAPFVWRRAALGEPVSRCGVYAWDWEHDLVTLAPGESIPVEFFSLYGSSFEFAHSGRVRVRAHLVYTAGLRHGDASFELYSAPLYARIRIAPRNRP